MQVLTKAPRKASIYLCGCLGALSCCLICFFILFLLPHFSARTVCRPAPWFTARMVCQVSYKAIATYQEEAKKKLALLDIQARGERFTRCLAILHSITQFLRIQQLAKPIGMQSTPLSGQVSRAIIEEYGNIRAQRKLVHYLLWPPSYIVLGLNLSPAAEPQRCGHALFVECSYLYIVTRQLLTVPQLAHATHHS